MAGWSILTNGSVIDHGENVVNNGSCKLVEDGGPDDDCCDGYNKVRPSSIFDQVLSLFLKEIAENGILRPAPAMLGGGQQVDLFKLFRAVRDRGGYDRVSKKKLWAFVAKKSGLSRNATAAVKLIYFKYVNELVKWFRGRCRDRGSGNGQCGFDKNLQFLSLELETEFRNLFSDGSDRKGENGGLIQLESDHRDSSSTNSGNGKCRSDNDKKIKNDGYGDLQVSNLSDNKKGKEWKRKRESLSGMLKWLIQTAKHPDDPSVGRIPESSKWKEHKDNELWLQAIRVRESLLLERHTCSNTKESPLQKKQKMHPSMYEDNMASNHHSTERLRCSERVPNLVKSRACRCCNPCSAGQSKLSPLKLELEKDSNEEAPAEVDLLATDTKVSPPEDEPIEKHVSVGPHFQADVPEWTGVVIESDPKWLGTQVWPVDCGEHKSYIETDSIGQGRSDFCGCSLPGSVECVRFHIAEVRMKLKLQLGLVFYHWKFDRMGEEVSLQWTAEEEKRFKDVVRSSHGKSFWDDVIKWFPTKTREKVVSYYFNVFLIQRRSYQNRVTPKIIDSDDDETELGSLSEGFRHDAVKVSGSTFLSCCQNTQCFDLEQT